MIRYFASHPTAANILMFAIILLGVAALPGLNKETFPEVKLNKVSVTIAYPGASPAEVEESICNRLEDVTDGISFVDEQACEAKDNIGILTLDMKEGGDIKQFLDDVSAAVDGITNFPDEAEEAVIKELGRTEAVASIAINSNLSQPELKLLAEHYRTRLLEMPEVPIVTVSGFSTHELAVLLSPETLRQYQLSVQDVANLIRDQALDLPVGILEAEDTYYQIRFENERHTVDELADLVILNNDKGGQIRLGDIARIKNDFSDEAMRTELNGHPAALLNISKNKTEDSLTIFRAVKAFVDAENARLPESTRLVITQDSATIVQDRLDLLLSNAWQGLLLATIVLFGFFTWRYTFWVAMGLPVSFLGGLALVGTFGVSINMISMVALLMAIGILMDDAIVISESIAAQHQKGATPVNAAIEGIQRVFPGVASSYATSMLVFGGLLFLEGDMGQIMRILPIVLLSVLTVSLREAFLLLPHHLLHSLEHQHTTTKSKWRLQFDAWFEDLREKVGSIADTSVQYRYLVVGSAISLFLISISLVAAGVVKFKSFPDLEGNILEARVLMPQGTPFERTEKVVSQLIESLGQSQAFLPEEDQGELIKNIQITYGTNTDAGEQGEHLATISLDLLNAQSRKASLNELRRQWKKATPPLPDAVSIQFKEPVLGPAGKAISIRIQGNDLQQLSNASWQLQYWLRAYTGVSNVMDDLRPGKPQFSFKLLPGYLDSGIDAKQLSAQLRAAYQGVKVGDVYQGREAYEINVRMDSNKTQALADLHNLILFNRQGEGVPLKAIASVEEKREFSRIVRINHQRTVSVTGDIDASLANTNEVISDTQEKFLPKLRKTFPELKFSLEGEVRNSKETNASVLSGFVLSIAGVYLLLCLQFRNYREPFVVLINIPLALVGVIWGHWAMGLDLTMPSMVGFVSLAGVVVNDSILLVEFVKHRQQEGLSLHTAASQAVRDRFRAIFLTSLTTVAGMLPLLSETSLQAQVLVPLVTSVVFGMASSTILILLVLPAVYAIFEDFGFLDFHRS